MGAIPWWGLGILFLLLLVLAAEFALGFLILEKGGGRAPARLLAAYLLLLPLGFGPIVVGTLMFGSVGSNLNLLGDVALAIVSFVPACLLGFSLCYPTRNQSSRSRPIFLGLPFAPLLVILPAIALNAVGEAMIRLERTWQGGYSAVSFPLGNTLAFVYLAVGPVIATFVFWKRRRQSATQLEERRLRFMLRAIAFPLAVAGSVFGLAIIFGLLSALVPYDAWFFRFFDVIEVLGAVALALLILIPGFGLSYGVLRFKMLDLDRRVRKTFRFTLSQGMIAAIFLAVFFLVSELAAAFLTSRTNSTLLGVGGAALLVFAIAPLHRLADLAAQKALPAKPHDEKYHEFRRWEVYRATFEELSADEVVTARERRALESLAKSLNLSDTELQTIETQVALERGASRRTAGS